MANVPALIPVAEPLTPADCDLQSYGWFALHYKRLRRSGWWLHASDTAKALSIDLWCEAYEQIPAASLPNDDFFLSDQCGYGRRDLAMWLKVKEEVMKPWVLCADGRWYHPTLAQVAIIAWMDRLRFQKRSGAGNAKRHGKAFDPKAIDRAIIAAQELLARVAREYGSVDKQSTSSLTSPSRKPQGSDMTGKGQDMNKKKAPPLREGAKEAPPVAAPRPAKAKAPKPERKGRPAGEGHRLPVGWYADAENRQYAILLGFTAEEVDEIEESFRLWWPAQPGAKGRKADWSLTWKSWVRRERESRDEKDKRARARGRGPQSTDRIGALYRGGVAAADARAGIRPGGGRSDQGES